MTKGSIEMIMMMMMIAIMTVLVRLTFFQNRERESLAIKLKNDGRLLEEKMSQAAQLAEQNDSLSEKLDLAHQRITYLEGCLTECRETTEADLAAKEGEISHFQEQISQYERALRDCENRVERVVEGRVGQLRTQFDLETKGLKESLDESQRELAKSNANLSQVGFDKD